MPGASLPLAQRVSLAFAFFFRVLFDGAFAHRASSLAKETKVLPPRDTTTRVAGSDEPGRPVEKEREPSTQRSAAPPQLAPPSPDAALNLLAIFQREGRLVDFLQQDVEAFPDADIGAAARVVHGGCRRALLTHFDLVRVRDEAEGTAVSVSADETAAVKLTGDVRGNAPYRGVLRHGGWRARRTTLPALAPGHDVTVVCEAEVEL